MSGGASQNAPPLSATQQAHDLIVILAVLGVIGQVVAAALL